MVYPANQWVLQPKEWGVPLNPPDELPSFVDSGLFRTAQVIYRDFQTARPDFSKRPTGIVVDRVSHRGKPVFTQNPALLPTEDFVPVEQLDPKVH